MELDTTPKLTKVLLVDDDEEDYFIIKRLFRGMSNSQFTLDWVSTSEEAIKAIKNADHDLYLIDYRLDARTGLDVLQEVNASERAEPFILLTGVGDRAIEEESLQLAASDYVVKKQLTSDVLSRTIYYALGRKEQERQKLDQLIELNRTKDEFISIASHQLRTPATTVKQYVAMVIDGFGGEITEKQKALLVKAYDSNERQLTIINDLLKVAQIDNGTMQLHLEPLSVSSLVEDAVTDITPLFTSRKQRITCAIEPDVHAKVDENAMRMAIDNLLENAKKYSEAGATTTVIVQSVKKCVEIIVADEGVGVDHPERLFQKFSRINNKLSTEVGGTGLGLYWAHTVAQSMGGTLRYETNISDGSKFVLSFPAM
jgi:signal transduction histidine kinase